MIVSSALKVIFLMSSVYKKIVRSPCPAAILTAHPDLNGHRAHHAHRTPGNTRPHRGSGREGA